MNKFDNVLEQILDYREHIPLIKKIKTIAEQQNLNYSWQTDKDFNDFIKELKNHISSCEKDWQEDSDFLDLIKAVNKRIIEQLNEGGEEMATGTELATTGTGLAIGTKFIIAAGVLSVIAIALYAYRCSKSKIETSSNEKDEKSTFKKIEEKVGEKLREVKSEIDAGFENPNSNRPQQQVSPPSQPTKKTTPIYEQYVLLLIIEAKRLDKNLKLGSFSKDEAEKLISNAMFAYCFAENDSQGKTVLEAVELSKDEDINYESEDKVFLQLSLSAKPKIADGKPDKLGIREAMNPKQPVEIKTLKKLLKTRSITAFHSLV
jgi:hypothetical protein